MSVPSKIVMDLMGNLLGKGRTLYTDNWYTSCSLATELLKQNTHLVGTLRVNRKFNPKDVVEKKLKKDETVAAECKEGIVVQKWRDKRDVLCLSTKHTDEMVRVQKRGQDILKPKIIMDYNKCKAFIDLSDQVKAYNTSLRRSLKWYRKLALELLTGMCLVNAYVAHQQIANENMSITKFREEVVKGLLRQNEVIIPNNVESEEASHILEDVGRANRRRCVICYAKISEQSGSKEASRKTPQSSLKYSNCEKHYCLTCFFVAHNAKKNIK